MTPLELIEHLDNLDDSILIKPIVVGPEPGATITLNIDDFEIDNGQLRINLALG